MVDEHDDDIEPEVDESDVETVHYGDVTDDTEDEADTDRVNEPDADEDDDALDDDPDTI